MTDADVVRALRKITRGVDRSAEDDARLDPIVWAMKRSLHGVDNAAISTAPLRLAIVNDYELVAEGLAAMLAPFPDQITVAQVATNMPRERADIDLVDMFTTGPYEFDQILRQSLARKVVIYTWALDPKLAETWIALGAAGVLSKTLTAEDLLDALERIEAGETVVSGESRLTLADPRTGGWPGQQAGLTVRESEIVGLVATGLSNQQIADQSFISINTVKSYIRSAYRKMGVTSRSKALLWALDHGIPEPKRAIPGRRLSLTLQSADPRSETRRPGSSY